MTLERFNPNHAAAGSSTGGQFTSGGGGGGKASAKKTPAPHGSVTHPKSAPSKPHPKSPGPLKTTLSYDAKSNHGAGYGECGGDPHVHELQRALNRLGVTDAYGKPLVDDGKLGPKTTSSIKSAQRRLGIKPADGKVTPQFYAQLLALKSMPASHHATHHPSHHAKAPATHRGAQTLHPADTERLHEYWVHGEGAAKIGWGSPGDFDRCVGLLSKYMPGRAAGYCNLAHHAALGFYPATHAKMEGKSMLDLPAVGFTAFDERATLSTAELNNLPDSAFAYIQSGGSKDSSGKTVPRSYRHFAIHDAAHVRNALARIAQGAEFGQEALRKVKAAANKMGIDAGSNGRPDLGLCVRAFDFEMDGPAGDGRTLEGYAAVFNTPARIRDLKGDFDETIRPGAFGRSLRERTPVLQFDHGKDPRIGAAPIGAIDAVSEDSRGLHVRARLFDHPDIERVRLAIEARAIRGMSFRFGVPDGGDAWSSRGGVDQREIRDADVHELGPVVFPAYDTTSVSVRSLLAQLDPDEHRTLIRELAAELRGAVDLADFTGRSAQGADGGEYDAEPDDDASFDLIRQRVADDDALRLKGILR